MSLLKRLVTTVHASVDRTVASIENHEAIVDAALRDSREAVTKARQRLARLDKDGKDQRDRIIELTSEIELWNDRARSVADQDRARALDCLRRRKQRETALDLARASLKEHEAVAKSVRSSITESTQRVQTLQQQRNQMRSREAATQARRTVHALDERAGHDVESAIERWEVSVGESELLTDTLLPLRVDVDDLADEFLSVEENTMLESELDQLLKPAKGENDE